MFAYPVPAIRCMFCGYRLKRAIQIIDPGILVRIDYRTRSVILSSQDDVPSVERALAHLAALA